jgi:hypothetical protein
LFSNRNSKIILTKRGCLKTGEEALTLAYISKSGTGSFSGTWLWTHLHFCNISIFLSPEKGIIKQHRAAPYEFRI